MPVLAYVTINQTGSTNSAASNQTGFGLTSLMPPYLAAQMLPSTLLIQPWITQSPMFTPYARGLYYHAIPTAATTVASIGYGHVISPWPPRPPAELARPAFLRGRRALRRSIALFRRFRPEAEVKTFLDGQPLVIQGHRFDYRVQKRDDLLWHTMNPNTTHIPYDLHLLDKTGRILAKGCVIIPGTPVIDQVLALILHVQDADEESVVINTTNWSPSIAQHLRENLPLAA